MRKAAGPYGTNRNVSMLSAHLRASLFLVALMFGACALCACVQPGPYGFDRTYRPLATETGHFDHAEQLSYQDVLREPNAYKDTEITWFGVVTSLALHKNGITHVHLQLRAHQPRHLCRDETRESCRVTVGETDLGAFSAELTLRPEDQEAAKTRLAPGSLLKVYGMPSPERDEHEKPLLIVTYYRHWPHGTFVTTAARRSMLR